MFHSHAPFALFYKNCTHKKYERVMKKCWKSSPFFATWSPLCNIFYANTMLQFLLPLRFSQTSFFLQTLWHVYDFSSPVAPIFFEFMPFLERLFGELQRIQACPLVPINKSYIFKNQQKRVKLARKLPFKRGISKGAKATLLRIKEPKNMGFVARRLY